MPIGTFFNNSFREQRKKRLKKSYQTDFGESHEMKPPMKFKGAFEERYTMPTLSRKRK